MEPAAQILLTGLIFLAALLYSSVGYAGASGYLAVMGLFAVPPEVMRPAALGLNVLVAAIAALKFYRSGSFSWSLFLPFALSSVPMAFVGGSLHLPAHIYTPLVGGVLIVAAARLVWASRASKAAEVRPAPLWQVIPAGAAIGLLSGLTGVGGGIFLSPLVVLRGWATPRQTAGVAAAFILVNSTAALLALLPELAAAPGSVPASIGIWAVAAGVGGWMGAELGSRRLRPETLQRILALVLVVAGVRMMVG